MHLFTFATIFISLKKEKKQYGKTAILVSGPTAAGKTGLAIALAQHFHTEIISADSRQCFKEMTIGTAVPSPEELAAVPHHFIHSHAVTEKMNAGIFEQYALQKTEELFSTHDVVVVCGGTGLYLKAFSEGIDHIPQSVESVALKIKETYQQKGLSWLQRQLQEKDPTGYVLMEQKNPQRLMRALAVLESTGESIKKFQTGISQKRPFHILKIGLTLPREKLWQRIAKRSNNMIQQGLIEEARTLYPLRKLNALQTVGYKEIFDYLDGKYSLEEAIQQLIIHTRQYAKRQMTWFRKDKDIQWFCPGDENEIISYTEAEIKKAQF